MITSIAMCFQLALTKTLIEKDLEFREDLRNNFLELRKTVSHGSEMKDADKIILDMLGIEDELGPQEEGPKVIDRRSEL